MRIWDGPDFQYVLVIGPSWPLCSDNKKSRIIEIIEIVEAAVNVTSMAPNLMNS